VRSWLILSNSYLWGWLISWFLCMKNLWLTLLVKYTHRCARGALTGTWALEPVQTRLHLVVILTEESVDHAAGVSGEAVAPQQKLMPALRTLTEGRADNLQEDRSRHVRLFSDSSAGDVLKFTLTTGQIASSCPSNLEGRESAIWSVVKKGVATLWHLFFFWGLRSRLAQKYDMDSYSLPYPDILILGACMENRMISCIRFEIMYFFIPFDVHKRFKLTHDSYANSGRMTLTVLRTPSRPTAARNHVVIAQIL
jgi:hypothetical protein